MRHNLFGLLVNGHVAIEKGWNALGLAQKGSAFSVGEEG